MGGCTPEPGIHPGKPTPGGKSRNTTHCDQDPATRNAIGASKTTCMEKPRPADQHQRPIGPLTTSTGEPTTPKPGTDATTTETPGGTRNARNEAATGATQVPRVPKATSTQAGGRTRRKSPLNTTRIISGTSFGPAVGTTSTTFPTPLLSFAT